MLLFSIIGISTLLSVGAAIAADIWLSERIAVIGSFAGLQYTLNPGIAWGIRLPPFVQEILIGLALVAVLYLTLKPEVNRKFSIFHFQFSIHQTAYGLVIGGGLANIIDRLRDGVVTDYIQIGSFPIFNVADTFVCIGVALLFLEILYTKYRIRHT